MRWIERLVVRAREARQRLRAQLDSARVAGLLLRLLAWSEAGPHGRKGLRRVATRRLDRLLERVARATANWSRASATQRHRVRILVKRLRYGVELAVPGDDAREWRGVLRTLQEELGEFNDFLVARATLRRLRVPEALIERVAPTAAAHLRIERAGSGLVQLLALPPPWR